MKNANRKTISIITIITFVLLIIPTASAGPLADFCDAPDPTYPSLLVSDGARHLDSSYEWLGDSVNSENDSKQINRDLFDDGVALFLPYEQGQQGKVNFSVNVTDAHGGRYSSATDKLIYVNAWFDWNCDGDWNDTDEHVIDGRPIDPSTFPLGVNNMTFTETFTVPSSAVRGLMWIRFRLDHSQNVNTTTGEADFGEVEDHRTSGNFFDLYLDPDSVPEDFYDEFFIPASGTVFLDKLPEQGDITAVRIAPPITLTPEEEFIPVEHYSVYLNVNGTSEVFFFRPGVYAINVERSGSGSTDIYFVFCDAGHNSEKKGKKETKYSLSKDIETPTGDVIIVEHPGAGGDNGFDGNCAKANVGEKRANTVQEAIKHINKAYQNNGNKPVSVVIYGHGCKGKQNIGRGQGKTPAQKDEFLLDNNVKVQNFCKSLKGKVSKLTLMGCKVGADESFLQHLANCLCCEVCAYDKVMYASSWFGLFWAKISKDRSAQLVCKSPNIVGKINLTNIGPEYQEVLPGKTAEFTIQVKNEGCVKDTIQLTHKNISESGSCSWTVGLSKNNVTLDPCDSENITLSVTAASDCEISSRKKVNVTGTSQNGLNVGETITDSVVKETHNVPEFTTIAIPVAAILGLLFLFSRRRRKP